ncbi:flavin-dependent oxidoreductase [Streptomyces sp. NPDC053048]|uniref:flavin-dependent oxidoreductase n=1 Tax=Streptomyces sp. NPDC053048 TaxID=3365694 RepID=UPI0037D453D6
MRILIAGAGIGGLAAALSLHAEGFTDITVAETVQEIRPLGVGLNILPNAVRELDELGVYEELVAASVRTGELSYYNRHGQLIWNEPRGLAAGYNWPQLSIHRGRLQMVLAKAVRERLGAHAIVTDSRITGFSSMPTGRLRVSVAHPSTSTVSETEADVLLGADGIHSAVRATLHPGEGAPRWNGLVVWRGATWSRPFLNGRTMVIAGDDRRRGVVYPMSTGAGPDEPVLMNWAVARRAEGEEIPDRADWNRRVHPEDFLHHFADWDFPWLDIPALVRTADEAFEYPMVDRDPLPHWTRGRVTLLGDAAHAMYPMGSNGATQSIVDARVLAHCLAGHDDVEEALADYEERRRPAMTELQLKNRQMGPEVVINIAHERAPDGFASIHDVMSEAELAGISAKYAQVGAFDTHTVNQRPAGRVSVVKVSP